eukprot:jgi/Chlat1/5211/Chrsp33S05177
MAASSTTCCIVLLALAVLQHCIHSASAQYAPPISATLPVTFSEPDYSVDEYFLCYSIAWKDLHRYLGLGLDLQNGTDMFLAQLLRNLGDHGHRPLLRVNSDEGTSYNDKAVSCDPKNFEMSLSSMVAATGIRVIPVLAFPSRPWPSPPGALFIRRLVQAIGVSNIVGIEAHNEPDSLVSLGLRLTGGQDPSFAIPYTASIVADFPYQPWGYDSFASVWEDAVLKLQNSTLLQGLSIPSDILYAPVITGTFSHPWKANYSDFIDRFMTGPNSLARAWSLHHYSIGQCSRPDYPFTLEMLMATPAIPTFVNPIMPKLRALGHRVVFTEHATMSCGGRANISDTFGAALHEVHYMLQAISMGVSVVCQTANTGAYAPFLPSYRVWNGVRDPWEVRAPYYASYIVAQVVGAGAHVNSLPLTPEGSSPDLEAWAVYDKDTTAISVVVIQKTPTKTPMSKRPLQRVSISVIENRGIVQVKRLQAASAWNKFGITWDGQTFDNSQDGLIGGKPAPPETISPAYVNGYYVYSTYIRLSELSVLRFSPMPPGPPPPPSPSPPPPSPPLPPSPPPSPPPPPDSLLVLIKVASQTVPANVSLDGKMGTDASKVYGNVYIGSTYTLSAVPYYYLQGKALQFVIWSHGATTPTTTVTIPGDPPTAYLASYSIRTPIAGTSGALDTTIRNVDIGGATFPTFVPGGAYRTGNTGYNIAAGGLGVRSDSDQFNFLYRVLTSKKSVAIQMRLRSVSYASYRSSGGIMLRSDSSVGAANAYLYVTALRQLALSYRQQSLSYTTVVLGPVLDQNNAWLRLSIDTQVPSFLNLASVYVGVAAAAECDHSPPAG